MDEFDRWFAREYGEEFDRTERLQGLCNGCGTEGEVLAVGICTVGQGMCLTCIREDHALYEENVQEVVTALRAVEGEAGLPTEAQWEQVCADAYRRRREVYMAAIEHDLAAA